MRRGAGRGREMTKRSGRLSKASRKVEEEEEEEEEEEDQVRQAVEDAKCFHFLQQNLISAWSTPGFSRCIASLACSKCKILHVVTVYQILFLSE